jgi:hypothetical protein
VRLQTQSPLAGRPRLKASDALTARSDRLDLIRERLHELLQEFAGAVADELAMLVEQLVGMSYGAALPLPRTYTFRTRRIFFGTGL